jgi:hypothetical protein
LYPTTTSCNRDPNNLAKHARPQLIMDREYLLLFQWIENPGWSSSDFRFRYVFHIATFWKFRILANIRNSAALHFGYNLNRYPQFRVWNSSSPPYLFLPKTFMPIN